MKQEAGFTLIETLIALLLVSIAIITFLGVTARGMRTAGNALDQAIAQTLAQEGIELARNVRDSNFLQGGVIAWDSGLSACTNGCTISQWPAPIALNPCASILSACARLSVNAQGQFTHSQALLAGATPFRRIITVSPVDDGLVVTSLVGWGSGRTVRVTTYLTNWFQAPDALTPVGPGGNGNQNPI